MLEVRNSGIQDAVATDSQARHGTDSEDAMDSTMDRSGAEPTHADSNAPAAHPATIDVPSMLAGSIGNLYAEEEIHRRHERTEKLIKRAEALGEA